MRARYFAFGVLDLGQRHHETLMQACMHEYTDYARTSIRTRQYSHIFTCTHNPAPPKVVLTDRNLIVCHYFECKGTWVRGCRHHEDLSVWVGRRVAVVRSWQKHVRMFKVHFFLKLFAPKTEHVFGFDIAVSCEYSCSTNLVKPHRSLSA